MQTFLPYADFKQSALVLDRQRLGKQRVEALQILRTLYGISDGWTNHPAVKMWKGYEPVLALYALEICAEWSHRGYIDSCWKQINALVSWRDAVDGVSKNGQWILCSPPAWLGDPAFHASHRSNLLRKDPDHYGQFGWTELPTLPYVWPVR